MYFNTQWERILANSSMEDMLQTQILINLVPLCQLGPIQTLQEKLSISSLSPLLSEKTPKPSLPRSQISIQVTSNTHTFTFTADDVTSPLTGLKNVKKFYPDLSMLGHHYLVSDGRVHRHYTIANCMQKEFYEALTNSDALPDMKDEDCNQLCLTIKDYGIGLSKTFNLGKTYQIQGPLGKGLGLTQDSEGEHIAFAAGTGILPFVDLVSRIIMNKDLPTSQQLSASFKLKLYASFASRNDAIALKILENVVSPNYQLFLRFSDEKSARWDYSFINSQISKDVKKVWVCGPPLMEENFDQILEKICKEKQIHYLTQIELM